MAQLRHRATGASVALTTEHTIGRSGQCLLRLHSPRASGMHALLRWTGEDWELRDLGSRNGTLIDGQRLDAGQRQLLAHGSALGFGDVEDPWDLIEAGPPEAAARDGAGAWVIANDGLLLLPDACEPELVIYLDPDARWVVETAAEVTPLGEEPELSAGGRTWRVYTPRRVVPTNTSTPGRITTLDEIELRFEVSQDEEDVQLEIHAAGRMTRVPHHANHYFLLCLARARAEDRQLGDSPSGEQGWRYQDELCRQLRIPESQFNVTIYRARQLLVRAGVADAARLIERRRGSGQLRLGTERFSVR